MKKETKWVVAVYAVAGIGLMIGMGILSFLLSVSGLLSSETNQYLVETVSSLFGSVYLAFVCIKLNKKSRERQLTRRLAAETAAAGLLLAAVRSVDRLLLTSCLRAGLGRLSYPVSAVPELAALAGLFFLLPSFVCRGKEEAGHA